METKQVGNLEKVFIAYNNIYKEAVKRDKKYRLVSNRFLNAKPKMTSGLEKLLRIKNVVFEEEKRYTVSVESYIYIYNMLFDKKIVWLSSKVASDPDFIEEFDDFLHYHDF